MHEFQCGHMECFIKLTASNKSAGVQRQYSGTAGRIENCQLGVFLTYVTPRGRALIDRELYVLESWITDRDRCRAAGIDDEVGFATKPELARQMLQRLIEADQRLSAGAGSKGDRLYDWLLIDPGADDHQLLIRRSISKPSELAYYICHSLTPVPLAELVRVAGSRWGVEETFQFAKNETGLDHYQVRKYQSWYRHITLSRIAAAFLAVTAHAEHLLEENQKKWAPQPTANQYPHILQRNQTALGHLHPFHPPPSPHRPLVTLATTPPNPRPHMPLSATKPQTSQNAAVALKKAHSVDRATETLMGYLESTCVTTRQS